VTTIERQKLRNRKRRVAYRLRERHWSPQERPEEVKGPVIRGRGFKNARRVGFRAGLFAGRDGVCTDCRAEIRGSTCSCERWR